MSRFFLYDPEGDGMQLFATAEERDAAATEAIKLYLDGDGWSEDVESAMVGEVTGRATMCDVVHQVGKIDDEGVDEAGEYWPDGGAYEDSCKCNYRIEPAGRSAPTERNMETQWWLAELNMYGNGKLADGPHTARIGAEQALYLLRRMGMAGDRKFAIAEVRLTEPTGEHGPVNEEAVETLNAIGLRHTNEP